MLGPAATGRATAPVRMGYLGVSSDVGIFIALDKGYFKEQGLDLSLERFGVGADQMAHRESPCRRRSGRNAAVRPEVERLPRSAGSGRRRVHLVRLRQVGRHDV
ncbi:MAG TPA: hypothetical protein VEW91_05885 [bacterium]|nr:hypothetical protein [bacterium]